MRLVDVPLASELTHVRFYTNSFDRAPVGYWLDGGEQRRRWLLKSLLRADGLVEADYVARFGGEPTAELPQLLDLVTAGLAEREGGVLRLSAAGLERSDAIGPWLGSEAVRSAMRTHRPR